MTVLTPERTVRPMTSTLRDVKEVMVDMPILAIYLQHQNISKEALLIDDSRDASFERIRQTDNYKDYISDGYEEQATFMLEQLTGVRPCMPTAFESI